MHVGGRRGCGQWHVHTGRHAAPLFGAPEHIAVHVQLLHRHGPAPHNGRVPEDGVVRERDRCAPEQVRRGVRLLAQHRVLRPARPGDQAVQRARFPYSRPQARQQQPQVSLMLLYDVTITTIFGEVTW